MLCLQPCLLACFYALLGTLLLCSAWNTASSYALLGTLLPPVLCSEHCFLACFYALLGNLSSEQGGRVSRKMVQLGTWGFGLCSQYMCVPSCRDNLKLRTCLVCLVN